MMNQPKRIGGNYEIVRMIGRGGFGIVYEGRHVTFGDRVAIKEFCPNAIATRRGDTIALHNERDRDLYARVLKRFEKTTVLQRGFDHPNILKVRDYIPGSDTGYMVTDYVDGASLREHLQKYGGHVPSERMFDDIFRPIVDALAYVHAKGHLHRDIAPDNIMIDRFDKPVLIDFGAMKRTLQETAIPGRAVGGGQLARGSYYILVTTTDAHGDESRTYAASEPIDVAANGAIEVELPALSNFRFNVYLGATDRPTNLGACAAGPSEGPLKGQSTQLAPNQRVTLTAIGAQRTPPQASSLIFVKEDYTPLEQQAPARDRPERPYTDIFALGGTMYYALAGEPPMRASLRYFASGGDAYETIAGRAKIKCPPEVYAGIDRSLDLAISKRPQSIEEFRETVGWSTTKKLPPEPPAPQPQPPPPEPPPRRSPPWLFIGAAAAAAVLAVGIFLIQPPPPPQPPAPPSLPAPAVPVPVKPADPSIGTGPQATAYCDQAEAFNAARNASGYDALRAYIQRCGSGGAYVGPARAEFEDRVHAAATSCIRTSSGCNFDGCVQIYVSELPNGSRASAVRQAAADAAQSRCPAPTQPSEVLPNGVYSAVRTYDAPNPPECLASYDISDVQIYNGTISFESGGFRWQGTVNQRTGSISIPNNQIRNVKDNSPSRRGLSVSGDYRNATLQSGLCGSGTLVIRR